LTTALALVVALVTPPAHGFVVPTFGDFTVRPITLRHVKPPDVSSGEARTYRTVLREGARAGVNFAGHYTVVMWGCGVPCKRLALIDRGTGTVYFPPVSPALGAEFRVDSALLIADSPDMIRPQSFPEMYYTQYWRWDEGDKSFRPLGERYLESHDAERSRP
jgi:hypothetical protein